MSKKGEYIKFKKCERKIKPPFMIYADFEINGKQNLKEFYTNKYQRYITCIYSYILVCVDDKLSKTFKTYLGEDAV